MRTFSPTSTFRRVGGFRSAFLALVLAWGQPRAARGEDSLNYKFQSWQEEHQRIRVDAHYLLAEKDLGPDTHLKAMGVIDSIAGATPTGELPATPGGPAPLAHMEDLRKAWNVELSHPFRRVTVTAGYAVSRESDYVSHGWSINTVTEFNQKNTSLLLGYGRTDDTIMEPKLGWTITRPKTGNDYIIGVTQLLNADTAITANFTYGRARGFMSDPYKIVSTTMLDLDPGTYYTPPENRPDRKSKVSIFLGLNRNFGDFRAAIDTSYRYYHDAFGITSHTTTVAWVQDLGGHFTLQPSIRFVRQSAADFYYHNLDQAGIVTTYEPVRGETGTGRPPFYSSDHRLSYMQTVDLGLKVTWKPRSWLWIDLAYDYYAARGLDHVTPQDLFNRASVFTLGFKLSR